MSKYGEEHPCPKCGSTNIELELAYYSSPESSDDGKSHSGVDIICNDCGWYTTEGD